MTIIELISNKIDDLPKAEKQVAELFLDHLDYVETHTITKIANLSNTSPSAVLRFCKSLGFKGFKDFRYAVIDYLRSNIRVQDSNHFFSSLQQYQMGLNSLQNISIDIIEELISAIVSAKRIFCFGLYQSSLPAKLLHYGLINLDKPTFFASDILEADHLTNLVDEQSVLIYFSVSADKSGIDRTLGAINENMPIESYLITSNHSPAVENYFKHVIQLPDRTYSHNKVIDSQAFPVILTEMILERIHNSM